MIETESHSIVPSRLDPELSPKRQNPPELLHFLKNEVDDRTRATLDGAITYDVYSDYSAHSDTWG